MDQVKYPCVNCGGTIEASPSYVGYIATCRNCYCGAPDSGVRVGHGAQPLEACLDYNEQFEEF